MYTLPVRSPAPRFAAQRAAALVLVHARRGLVMAGMARAAVAGMAIAAATSGVAHAQPVAGTAGAAPQHAAVATAAAPVVGADGTQAPVLSSPLPAGATMGGLPAGTGPGYHSPNSPIAPLPQRTDVVPWSTLSDLTKKTTKDAVLPVFSARQKALNKTVQRIQGFMVPLDAKATQTHFLLTSVPLTCAFCIPGGPESMVEVKASKPVRYSLEPVVVEGQFTLLPNDPYGLYYRLVSAEPVK